ncbi:MAG: MFS transporter [Bacteroidota bacterium]
MSDTQEATPKKGNSIGIIFLTAFIDLLGFSLVIPVLGPLLIDGTYVLDASYDADTRNLMYGLLSGIFPLFQFFGSSILGSLSDKYGRKPILLISLVISFVGYVTFTLGVYFGDLILMFVGRSIQGLAAGNLSILYSSVADVSSKEEKAKNFGVIGAAFGLGFVIGPFLGGLLSNPETPAQMGLEALNMASYFTFETPFIVGSCLVLINLLQVFFIFRETLTNRKEGITVTPFTGVINLAKSIQNPGLRSIFSVVFLQTFGFTFFTTMLQVFLIKRFAFDQGDIGMLFGFVGVSVVFTQVVLVRYFSGRVAPQRMLMFVLPGLAITLFLSMFVSNTLQLYLSVPFIAMFQGLTTPNVSALVSNMAPPQLQGEVLGMQQSVQALAQIIPPLVGGVIVSFSLTSPYWMAAVTIFLAFVAYFLQFGGKGKDEVPAAA